MKMMLTIAMGNHGNQSRVIIADNSLIYIVISIMTWPIQLNAVAASGLPHAFPTKSDHFDINPWDPKMDRATGIWATWIFDTISDATAEHGASGNLQELQKHS